MARLWPLVRATDTEHGAKTPDRVYFLPELPATQTGKILRKDLIASVS